MDYWGCFRWNIWVWWNSGINGCDGVNDVIIPGSLTPAIIGITGTSNVNKSGAWMFRVDQVQGMHSYYIRNKNGCLESMEWNGGMEHWNGILQ